MRDEARRLPGKQCELGEALRRAGLDEQCVAGKWREILATLEGGPDRKLYVEALKECGRLLLNATRELKRAEERGEAAVEMVHSVPRPARNTGTWKPAEAGRTASNPENNKEGSDE